MTARLSPRLAEIVAALPIRPHLRVLEIGCGPGAAARAIADNAIADQLTTGHILAIDRSATAIAQLKACSSDQIAAGHLSARHVAIEDFTLAGDEEPFDLVFAIRVGALDGRHPHAGRAAIEHIAAATHPRARLFIDGWTPPTRTAHPRDHLEDLQRIEPLTDGGQEIGWTGFGSG
ncbi:MAG: class I SAM-dependent methyltransferase [Rhodococcus sp. (in: high G+C Gram-positive bacteria)]|nr:MAG: class I SAM-dependent methyltransferase [Rhodococcus sp. (in: high G+C Gram-positive bacteria)]